MADDGGEKVQLSVVDGDHRGAASSLSKFHLVIVKNSMEAENSNTK
jgi:hypothetical protein